MRVLIAKVFSVESGMAFLTAVSTLCFSGEHLGLGDRLSHFTFYWAFLALGLVVRAVIGKRWMLCMLGGILLAVHGVPVASLWLPDAHVPIVSETHAELTVVSTNLYLGNRRKSEALAKLTELAPDLLVLMEVSAEWQSELNPIFEKFPHSLGTNGGLWLLSRYPLQKAACTEMKVAGSEESNAMLEATLIVSGSAIRVVAIHAPTPRGIARIRQQRRQATDYALALHRDEGAACRVLIGDFNTTPFSAVYNYIVKTTGLRDASQGYGYHPSWGPRLPGEPILPWIGIPIDHALVSRQILVKERGMGEIPGSDHRYQKLKLWF